MLAATLEDRLMSQNHADEDMSVLARAIRDLSAPVSGPLEAREEDGEGPSDAAEAGRRPV
jgi:hypothetical protein